MPFSVRSLFGKVVIHCMSFTSSVLVIKSLTNWELLSISYTTILITRSSTMKFVPPVLPSNPTPEQWRWWKKCFAEGLAINEITGDAHKLTFLRTHAGHELFALLEAATSFEAALGILGILDDQFSAPSRILYARHQLLTCTHSEARRMYQRVHQTIKTVGSAMWVCSFCLLRNIRRLCFVTRSLLGSQIKRNPGQTSWV